MVAVEQIGIQRSRVYLGSANSRRVSNVGVDNGTVGDAGT